MSQQAKASRCARYVSEQAVERSLEQAEHQTLLGSTTTANMSCLVGNTSRTQVAYECFGHIAENLSYTVVKQKLENATICTMAVLVNAIAFPAQNEARLGSTIGIGGTCISFAMKRRTGIPKAVNLGRVRLDREGSGRPNGKSWVCAKRRRSTREVWMGVWFAGMTRGK